MSRGLGSIQQACLAVLRQHNCQDSKSIASLALGKNPISLSEDASFRRALRSLVRKGLVVDMERNCRYGRRRWGLPEQAAAYQKRTQEMMALLCPGR